MGNKKTAYADLSLSGASGDRSGLPEYEYNVTIRFREDLAHLAARNRHELMRCWEVVHRTWVGEAHLRHLLHRKETRWPGYYYRSDYPDLDDANWRVFVNSKFDAANNTWELQTKPYKNIITSIQS